MSYEIFYNKQFVSLRKTGEVIPMLLAGSNNCYEIGMGGRSGRRSRDWCSDRFYHRKHKISEKPAVILGNLDAELRKIIRRHRRDKEAKPADIQKHFGYYAGIVVGSGHCADTSWGQYRAVYANGIKNALTIEQLDELNINLVFRAGFNSPNGMPSTIPIRTEREYFAELKKWREWQALGGRSFYLSYVPLGTDTVLARLKPSRQKPTIEKVEVEQDHYFVLTDGSTNLLRYTSRGYRYSYSKTGGKRFPTEKAAETYRQQLLANERYQADIWKVQRVESIARFLKIP